MSAIWDGLAGNVVGGFIGGFAGVGAAYLTVRLTRRGDRRDAAAEQEARALEEVLRATAVAFRKVDAVLDEHTGAGRRVLVEWRIAFDVNEPLLQHHVGWRHVRQFGLVAESVLRNDTVALQREKDHYDLSWENNDFEEWPTDDGYPVPVVYLHKLWARDARVALSAAERAARDALQGVRLGLDTSRASAAGPPLVDAPELVNDYVLLGDRYHEAEKIELDATAGEHPV